MAVVERQVAVTGRWGGVYHDTCVSFTGATFLFLKKYLLNHINTVSIKTETNEAR